MTKVHDKYVQFKRNEQKTWLDRMIWDGRNGLFNLGSFDKFIKSQHPFDGLHVMNADDYFGEVSKCAKEYRKWAVSVDNTYSEEDYDDMEQSFKGFMGEWFCYRIAEDCSRILVDNEMFVVREMAPNLMNERDNGIDFTATINDVPCVVQVKWWNRFIDKTFPRQEIFQKLGYEGATAGYIELNENVERNMCFMWLDDEEKAKMSINRNPRLKNRVIIFGKNAWDFSINGRDVIFWENIFKKLEELLD